MLIMEAEGEEEETLLSDFVKAAQLSSIKPLV